MTFIKNLSEYNYLFGKHLRYVIFVQTYRIDYCGHIQQIISEQSGTSGNRLILNILQILDGR